MVISKYDFDYDLKRTVIYQKFGGLVFTELPNILTSLALNDKVYKLLIKEDITVSMIENMLTDIKNEDEMYDKIIHFIELRGIEIEPKSEAI